MTGERSDRKSRLRSAVRRNQSRSEVEALRAELAEFLRTDLRLVDFDESDSALRVMGERLDALGSSAGWATFFLHLRTDRAREASVPVQLLLGRVDPGHDCYLHREVDGHAFAVLASVERVLERALDLVGLDGESLVVASPEANWALIIDHYNAPAGRGPETYDVRAWSGFQSSAI